MYTLSPTSFCDTPSPPALFDDFELPEQNLRPFSLLSTPLIRHIFSYLEDARDKKSFSLVSRSCHMVAMAYEKERFLLIFRDLFSHLYCDLPEAAPPHAATIAVALMNPSTLSRLYRTVWQQQALIAASIPPLAKTHKVTLYSNFNRLLQANLSTSVRHFLHTLFWKIQLAHHRITDTPDYFLLLFRGHDFLPLMHALKADADHPFITTLSRLPEELPSEIFPCTSCRTFQEHEAMLWVRFLCTFSEDLPSPSIAAHYSQLLLEHLPKRVNLLLTRMQHLPKERACEAFKSIIAWLDLMPWGDIKETLQTRLVHALLIQRQWELLGYFLDYKLDGLPIHREQLVSQCLIAIAMRPSSTELQVLTDHLKPCLTIANMKESLEVFLKAHEHAEVDFLPFPCMQSPSELLLPLKGQLDLSLSYIHLYASSPSSCSISILNAIDWLLYEIRLSIPMISYEEKAKLYRSLLSLFPNPPDPHLANACWSILAHQMLQGQDFNAQLWEMCLHNLMIPRDGTVLSPTQLQRLWDFCCSLLSSLPYASNAVWKQFFQHLLILVQEPTQYSLLRHRLLLRLPQFLLMPEEGCLLPDDLLFPV